MKICMAPYKFISLLCSTAARIPLHGQDDILGFPKSIQVVVRQKKQGLRYRSRLEHNFIVQLL